MSRSVSSLATLLMLASTLACGGMGASGVPMELQGEWYAADGRRVVIGAHHIGEYEASGLDGVTVASNFLFEPTAFGYRGQRLTCDGQLNLADGQLGIDLGAPCESLDGLWARTADGAKPKTASKKKTRGKPVAPGQCEVYVDCVCDIATRIRHRANDTSYQASCDAARALVDLNVTDNAGCRQALRDMGPWFDGIEAMYKIQGVEVPAHCRP